MIKVYVLKAAGYLEGVVSDEAFAKWWEESNPFYRAEEWEIDGGLDRLRQTAESERKRLAALKEKATEHQIRTPGF